MNKEKLNYISKLIKDRKISINDKLINAMLDQY